MNVFKSAPARRNTMAISVDQRFALLSALGANIDWNSLTTEQVQAGITGDLKRVGRKATLFIQSGFQVQIGEYFHETGEISIQIPALKRPTLKELQSKYDWIKSLERDTSTEEPVTLTLATVLVPDDGNYVDGKEYEKRIALKLNSLLGFQHMMWLIEHSDEFPELKPFLGKIYIDFPGIVVVHRVGGRSVPYCLQSGSRWGDYWNWLSRDFFFSFGRFAFGK
jgi:hypothetical protein